MVEPKKMRVAKGVKLPQGEMEKLQHKAGSSNAGKYKSVAPEDFAGPAGGASPYTFPINTLRRAKNAFACAFFAPKPEGIRRAVYKKYPELKDE